MLYWGWVAGKYGMRQKVLETMGLRGHVKGRVKDESLVMVKVNRIKATVQVDIFSLMDLQCPTVML